MQNEEAEAIFSWLGSNIAGSVHTGGLSWLLEGCGEKCYLWLRQKINWLDETTAPSMSTKTEVLNHPGNVTKLLVTSSLVLSILRSAAGSRFGRHNHRGNLYRDDLVHTTVLCIICIRS